MEKLKFVWKNERNCIEKKRKSEEFVWKREEFIQKSEEFIKKKDEFIWKSKESIWKSERIYMEKCKNLYGLIGCLTSTVF